MIIELNARGGVVSRCQLKCYDKRSRAVHISGDKVINRGGASASFLLCARVCVCVIVFTSEGQVDKKRR